MRSSANPHELSCQKYNQNNLVFLFFLPTLPVISAFPPLSQLWLLSQFRLRHQTPSVLLKVEITPAFVHFKSQQPLGPFFHKLHLVLTKKKKKIQKMDLKYKVQCVIVVEDL